MSDYQHKPGRGSVWKGDEPKSNSNAPDFKGDICLPDGTMAWLSGWKEQTAGGKSYLSVSVQHKEQQSAPPPAAPGGFADLETDINDDIDF